MWLLVRARLAPWELAGADAGGDARRRPSSVAQGMNPGRSPQSPPLSIAGQAFPSAPGETRTDLGLDKSGSLDTMPARGFGRPFVPPTDANPGESTQPCRASTDKTTPRTRPSVVESKGVPLTRDAARKGGPARRRFGVSREKAARRWFRLFRAAVITPSRVSDDFGYPLRTGVRGSSPLASSTAEHHRIVLP